MKIMTSCLVVMLLQQFVYHHQQDTLLLHRLLMWVSWSVTWISTGSPSRTFFNVVVDAKEFRRDRNRFSGASYGDRTQNLRDAEKSRVDLGQKRIEDFDYAIPDANNDKEHRMYADTNGLLSSVTSSQTFITTGSLPFFKCLMSSLHCM